MMDQSCILQVEDDENDVFFLQHAFKVAGLKTLLQVTRDGEEAIHYLSGARAFADRTQYPVPRLIILDLKMPRKSGFEVLQWLRHQSDVPHLPVIVFSSSAQPGDIDRAYELGANSFIVKPSCMEKRVHLAALIKDYWLQFNEAPAVRRR